MFVVLKKTEKKYICKECSGKFIDYISNKRKYCSRACKKLNKNEEVFCLECQGKFIAYKSLYVCYADRLFTYVCKLRLGTENARV